MLTISKRSANDEKDLIDDWNRRIRLNLVGISNNLAGNPIDSVDYSSSIFQQKEKR
jgi:hypothetical protein